MFRGSRRSGTGRRSRRLACRGLGWGAMRRASLAVDRSETCPYETRSERQMELLKAEADVFVPDGVEPKSALERTTHLCIAAHQDDIEIMAYHGIAECFGRREKWFTGVVVTNGAGSPRSGIYGGYTDAEMQKVRVVEQRKAAYVGEYACQIQLGFTSGQVKNQSETAVSDSLAAILRATRPEVVY